jgi:hypothetical protein
LLSHQGQLIIIGAFEAYMVARHILIQKSLTSAIHFWWAIVTVATVGIGDLYHVTKEGKITGATSTWPRKSNP